MIIIWKVERLEFELVGNDGDTRSKTANIKAPNNQDTPTIRIYYQVGELDKQTT